jgi:predicted Zn-dependent protease
MKGKRRNAEKNLCIIVSTPGSRSWKKSVKDAAARLAADISRNFKQATASYERVLYVGSYMNDFCDEELNLCEALGVQVVTLGFLELLENNANITMEEASLPPTDEFLIDWPRLDIVVGERPFPQTFVEFVAMPDRREYGIYGSEILLVSMMTHKAKNKKKIMKQCLTWFSAFFYPVKVTILQKDLPQEVQNCAVDYLSLLEQLEVLQDGTVMAVIGITNLDICDVEADETDALYGRATGDGSGIMSLYHFNASANRVFLSTAVHECLHVFGLDHCDYFECVMNPHCDAEKPGSVYLLLCPICLSKLKYCLKFDSAKRYSKMIDACRKLSLEDDVILIENVLSKYK